MGKDQGSFFQEREKLIGPVKLAVGEIDNKPVWGHRLHFSRLLIHTSASGRTATDDDQAARVQTRRSLTGEKRTVRLRAEIACRQTVACADSPRRDRISRGVDASVTMR
jgi:hypothetical protein